MEIKRSNNKGLFLAVLDTTHIFANTRALHLIEKLQMYFKLCLSIVSCNFFFSFYSQVEACQGDLSTLANVVTSLANFNKAKDLSQSSTELSIMESLSNGDASLSELPQDDQSSSEVTRYFHCLMVMAKNSCLDKTQCSKYLISTLEIWLMW